ncbi:MAG: Rho termination factor N-terminal domain-containing protein, partial [Mycobacteriaceae bacterium]|nr:Rho termination factor N-terminal domain-containing protein [Mycobacteriaceae bacterium]
MVLPELRALANEVGVKGASGMRKNELIAAIRERRGDPIGNARNGGSNDNRTGDSDDASAKAAAADAPKEAPGEPRRQGRERRGAARGTGAPSTTDQPQSGDSPEQPDQSTDEDAKTENRPGGDQAQGGDQQGGQIRGDDEGDGRQGRRGRRFRDRRRRERGGDGNGDAELREDDVVQPVAGILDVLDNYAFVRTSGYLAGPHDVYVSMNMVRKNGLRRGDAVTGAVRVPKDGEQP